MKLRILTQGEVRKSLQMAEAIEAMREAFRQLSAGSVVVPLRLPLETRQGVTLFMPACLKETNEVGAKIVSVYACNRERGLPLIHAVVVVLDGETGVPLALMDGAYLTALRTGAASGLATQLLSRPESSVLAVFGAGVQARTQVEAMRAVRPIRKIRIISRSAESARRFAAELSGIEVEMPDNRRATLRGADVVVAATTSRTPVFDGDDVEPGTHVNAIGSYKPEMQEVDARLVAKARIIVDSRQAALQEAGDLMVPMRDGVISEECIVAELGEIVSGDKVGRSSPAEITLFKSVGNAAQDVAIAGCILRAAEKLGLGKTVEL